MFNFSNFQRNAAAAFGALVISAAFVAAAVGPAHAVGQSPAADYAASQIQTSVQAVA